MGAAFFLALTLGAQPMATLRPGGTLNVRDREIRLGDLARVSGTPAASELEGRIVARFPGARRSVTLSRSALAALVRRAVPGLDVRGGPASLVLRREPDAPPARALRCFALASPIAAGAIVRPSDLTAADCAADNGRTAIRYDRRGGVARAAAALPAGAYLGRVALPPEVAVERGQTLTIVSSVGPVRIERPVTALQSGRGGGAAFVRDAEGQVFAAPIQATTGERQ